MRQRRLLSFRTAPSLTVPHELLLPGANLVCNSWEGLTAPSLLLAAGLGCEMNPNLANQALCKDGHVSQAGPIKAFLRALLP